MKTTSTEHDKEANQLKLMIKICPNVNLRKIIPIEEFKKSVEEILADYPNVYDRLTAEIEMKKAGIKSAKMAIPEMMLLSAQ